MLFFHRILSKYTERGRTLYFFMIIAINEFNIYPATLQNLQAIGIDPATLPFYADEFWASFGSPREKIKFPSRFLF